MTRNKRPGYIPTRPTVGEWSREADKAIARSRRRRRLEAAARRGDWLVYIGLGALLGWIVGWWVIG